MQDNCKKFFKMLFSFLNRIVILPLYLLYLLCAQFSHRDSVFCSCSQLLSFVPGKTGNHMRKEFYRLALKYCDNDCAICFGTIISHIDTEIGKGVYIGPNCNIGMVRLEDHVTIGSGVHILSGKHQHNFDEVDKPIQEQGGGYEKINIGSDSWIGNGSIIMDHVGKKCVIGAGSVVVKVIDDFSIAAGNPAKVIKKRL